MKKTTFQGLAIVIENPAGSIRRGKDKVTGKPWQVVMPYAYGYFDKTEGIDGDEVDVFTGPNKNAKFAYVVHQLDKNTGEWDEDKVMLGFDDAMTAKAAYFKSYDLPDKFYGTVETIPMQDFKVKLKKTKADPTMIHASTKMNKTIALYSGSEDVTHEPIKIGSQVTMDGMTSYRGIVTAVRGTRITVKFRNGVVVTKDKMFVHNIADRTKKMWSDEMNAGGLGSGCRGPECGRPMTNPKQVGNLHQALIRASKNAENTPFRIGKHPTQEYRDHFHKHAEILQRFIDHTEKLLGHSDELQRAKDHLDSAKNNAFKMMHVAMGNVQSGFEDLNHALRSSTKIHAGEEGEELEGSPIRTPATTSKRIKKVGTQFCIETDGVDKNMGCWPDMQKAEAVMSGKSFIEPDLLAGGPGSGRHSGYKHKLVYECKNCGHGVYQKDIKKSPPSATHCPECGAPKNETQGDRDKQLQDRYRLEAGKKKKIKSAGGMPQTGWSYGKRTMPVGYLPTRTLSGFPSGKGGGRGGLPKTPVHGTPKPSPAPKMGTGHKLPNPAGKGGTGHRMPNPAGTKGHGVRFSNPPIVKAFADGGEPVAGAYQHAHLDSNMFFHPPSLLKRNKETHIPTDDPRETNDKFLDVTKRKQAHKDRMKILKRSSPGNTQVPVHTTLLAPHQGATGMSSNLVASARRRRRNGGGMFRAYGAARI